MPTTLFPKAPEKQNSRDRDYTRWRTFWCMLWQSLNPDASGREVVRQLQALFRLENGPTLSEHDGAYCRAKTRLPLSQLPKALAATAKAADRQTPPMGPLQSRPLKAIDGSALTLADTPKNRKAYPPLQCADIPSFPKMRIVVLFSLLSGAISLLAQASLGVSELALFGSLMSQLARGDILLGIEDLAITRSLPYSSTAWESISSDGPPAASMAGSGSNDWQKTIGWFSGKRAPNLPPG